MTIVMPARRREADDLQALLEGRRASSRAASRDLAPLAGLARALAPVEHLPRPEFRAELRERLLAEVAAPSVPATASSVRRPADPPVSERLSRRARARQAVAAVAVTALVAGGGAAAASTRALPGDPLYDLKRGIENVQLALARGDAGHGRELLEQAGARLGEAERLAAGSDARSASTRTRIGQLLGELSADDAAATQHLTDAYRDSGDAAPMELLDRAVTEQQGRLDDLLPLLDPSLRDQARALLARLAAIGQQTAGVLGGHARAVGRSRPAGPGGGGDGDPLDAARGVLAAGGSASGGAAGPVDGALGAVQGAAASATSTGSGTGSGGGSSGRTGGPVGTVGGVVGQVTGPVASSLPTVSASARATVPLPLPSSSPLVTDPVGTVTSAVPLPTSSALPSVSACVAVPPLTTC